MFSSVFITDYAQTDAAAVNVAGSLRMQSFRMLAHIQQERAFGTHADNNELNILINNFEQDLNSGILVSHQILTNSDSLRELHNTVKQEWYQRVKSALLEGTQQDSGYRQLLAVIYIFVDEIDSLVTGYQRHAERNIRNIRVIQSLALFFTLLMIAFAMIIVNRHIERPLSNLINVARRIGEGDFTATAEVSGKGELTVLASTINHMSESIHRSQSYLEEKVRRSTRALRQSNASLELLFKTSRTLNDLQPGNYNFSLILNQLSNVTGLHDLDLCIMTPSGTQPFIQQTTRSSHMPESCHDGDCANCTQGTEHAHTNKLRYPLNKHNTNYGVLVVRPGVNTGIEEWQHQLFESLAEQIATGMSMMQQQEQNRRIALLAERTVIARELHDSLAQALSYLKIQVARLQKLQKKDNVEAEIDEVMGELRGGLNSAYRELRELLTTFRLKLEGTSLIAAFEQTVEQLKSRSEGFEFHIHYRVEHIPFTPQEEIHMLQIAREAMQNAVHHSQGENISVILEQEEDSIVCLRVLDDGIGIPSDPSKLNHYGLAIIHERSRSLGGDVNIARRKEKGTEVCFRFIPEYARQQMTETEDAVEPRVSAGL
ncbi:MAG: histidine kinase [Parahaliea sp.]